MTSPRPFITFLAVAAPALLLAGCMATAPTPTAEPGTPDPAVTSTPAAPEVELLDRLVDLKSTLDDWHARWLGTSCTDASIPANSECSTLLDEGVTIGTDGEALFTELAQATTIVDDLIPVNTGFTYAAWRGGLWREASCASVVSAECAELSFGLVDDLDSAHYFFSLWTR